MQATRLQYKVQNARSEDYLGEEYWTDFRLCVSNIGDEALLSEPELRKLYDRIISTRTTDERDIRGPFHPGRPNKSALLPGLLRQHRLTPIRLHPATRHDPIGVLKEANLSVEHTRGLMADLPSLPGRETFCYYAKEVWVLKLLKNRYGFTGEMNPLMKAAVLECLAIF